MSRTINQSVRDQASLDAIFKAFTEANEMERWWPSAVESDPKTGGSFKYSFELLDPSAPVEVRAGEYTYVLHNQSLSYPWNIPGMGPSTNVAMEFSAEGDRTVVSLEHSGWSSDEASNEVFSMHEQGWGGFLQNLKIVFEGGQDIRPTAMKMKTKA